MRQQPTCGRTKQSGGKTGSNKQRSRGPVLGETKKTKGKTVVEGIPNGWELVRVGSMVKGDWAIGGDGKPFEYTKDRPGEEHWPIIRRVEPEVTDDKTEMLAALANLRDQLEKMQRRIERLESEERRQRACAAM